MSCYYSVCSPQYFYRLLFHPLYGSKFKNDDYFHMSYEDATLPLRKYMSNNLFLEKDRKVIMEIVKKEWDLLHRVPRKISIMLVKRHLLQDLSYDKLEEYLNSDRSLYEIIDSIFSSKYSNVSFEGSLERSNYVILSLNGYYDQEVVEEEDTCNTEEADEVLEKSLNSNGGVSICLLIGSVFILIGVFISIIMVLD